MTFKQYLDYLADAFMVEKTVRYDVNGKRYMDTPAKYYFSDVGLRNARLNFRQQEVNHIMENIIYLELRSRGYRVDVGIVESQETNSMEKREKRQLEIDFVANRGAQKYYIQSSYAMPSKEKLNQEKRSLYKVHDSFKKIAVVKDDIRKNIDEHGIITIGVFDFLLNEKSMEQI